MFGPHTSIIFVPTARCNCDCAYCFQERSQANLSMEEVSTLFGRAAGYLSRSGVRRVDVYWQGGEIMVLSPDWCLEAGRAISALMGRQGVGCKHFLQTNLMEYTPEWDQVIWELFDGSVGSSLDFPNIHRRFRGLSGDDYSEHWTKRFMEASGRSIQVTAISVPNRQTLDVSPLDFYRYFVDEVGVRGIQLNTPFAAGPSAHMAGDLFLDPAVLGDFFAGLIEVYLSRDDDVTLDPFQGVVDRMTLANPSAKVPCFFCPNCVNGFFCIGPRGEVGQCDAWIGSYPDRNFGNLLECEDLGTILTSPRRKRLAARTASVIASAECAVCPYFSLCNGGCAVRTMSRTGSTDGKDPYCEAYKKAFAAIEAHARTGRTSRRLGSAPSALRPKSLVWGWEEPGAVVFSSYRCTNNCIFCAPAQDRGENPPDLDKQVYEFISTCADSGVQTLFFTGSGEPTLNRSLVDYVHHAKNSGIHDLYMFTNGFGVTESLIERLKDAGMENFWVSIHGLGETHDKIVRRMGSFVEAYRALSLINSFEPRRLNVNTCVNTLNIDDIELLMNKVLAFSHTTAHCLCLPEWDGNAYRNRDKMCRLAYLKERLSRISPRDYPITILDNMPHCVAPHLPHIGNCRNEVRIKRRESDSMVSNADNMGHNVIPRACTDARCSHVADCVGVDRRYLEEHGEEEVQILARDIFPR